MSRLLGPRTLPHYAVLAAFTLLGLTVAHVQISTRMIFSSCPAIYWYITSWILFEEEEKKDRERDREDDDANNNDVVVGQGRTSGSVRGDSGDWSTDRQWVRRKEWIVGYLALFHVLGIIMHVNWLPWT